MLSVLICAYNEEKTIAGKLDNLLAVDKDSVISQILVVDDNSTDATGGIAASYCGRDKRIALLKNEHKKGKWGALLTGLAHAQGDIVCITDADVAFEDDTIKKALPLFNDPSVGGVTTNQKNITVKNGSVIRAPLSFYERVKGCLREFESRMDSTASFHGQCMFVKKSCLVLPAEGPMCDDVYIAIQIRKNGHRALFCRDAYYIEKVGRILDKNSLRIFGRRAEAIAQVMIANRDLLFNPRYKRFGLICFPVEFFLHLVFPFIVFGGAAPAVLVLSLFLGYDFPVMGWLQMFAAAKSVVNLDKGQRQWETVR